MQLLKNIHALTNKVFGNNISIIIIIFIFITLIKLYEYCHISKYKTHKKKENEKIKLEGYQGYHENHENHENHEKDILNRINITKQIQSDFIEESFKTILNKIQFAKPQIAVRLFQNNSYLNTMNKPNIYARNFETHHQLKQKYQTDSLDIITNEEQNAVKWFVSEILKHLNKKNTKKSHLLINFIEQHLFIKTNPIVLAKSKSWLEHNMPHTHKNTVILPNVWYSDLVSKHKKSLDISAINNEGLTLIHEMLHVHQRNNQSKYNEFYNKWGFNKSKYIHNINEVFSKCRRNPDANDFNWIWKNNKFNYMICALLIDNSNSDRTDIDAYSLVDVSYKILKLNEIGENIYQYSDSFLDKEQHSTLKDNKSFNEFFGITNNHYHPNEIASQYLEHFFYDTIHNTQSLNTKGYKIFKKNIHVLV